MIDEDTIGALYKQHVADYGFDPFSFARAIWSLGRDAGLEEAVKVCDQIAETRTASACDSEAYGADDCANAIRVLKENKHDR